MTNNPWAERWEIVCAHLNTYSKNGLSDTEVAARLQKFGANDVKTRKPVSNWKILWQQLKSVIVLLLFLAAIVSFFLHQSIEAISIVLVLVINTLIGFLTEHKAIRSMEALRKLGSTQTIVLRRSQRKTVDADQLVPGDIVFFEAGDIITADVRLIESNKLSANEAALTGESAPVSKSTAPLPVETALAERENMLFKGTSLYRGSTVGVVTDTGMRTELGKIATLTEEAHQELTPLEKRLDKLGQKLVWISLFIAVFIALIGFLSGKNIILMIETAIALAVATIPEGLPIVATIALAKGMWRMAHQNALINKLSAVETLGATTTIFTDKTGTLTENKMAVAKYVLEGEEVAHYIHRHEFSRKIQGNADPLFQSLKIGVLCSNATIEPNGLQTGDPMEVALLNSALSAGISRKEALAKWPETKEEPFDANTRKMATYHRSENSLFVAVKGAPEAVFDCCTKKLLQDGTIINFEEEDRRGWLEKDHEIANQGLRSLGLAYKEVCDSDVPPYQDLIFVGLAGLIDPPKEDVVDAIKDCKAAGVKLIMVTGDQAGTAKKIAKDIGLDQSSKEPITGAQLGEKESWSEDLKDKIWNTTVFSRVSPQQKLDLIQFYQKQGAIVAMTGDGVNDAPALKKSDIGVAMGLQGTQVAIEASDMVLKDDKINTIVSAIVQGRVVFNNIRRFVVYLISCNISEVLVVATTSMINAPLLLTPLQILFLNLVTDVFPALALGMGEGDRSYLNRPPRDVEESIITNRQWLVIGSYGFILTIFVLMSYFASAKTSHFSSDQSLTIAFLTLGFSQLLHVFNMRSHESNIFINDVTKNPYIWGAIVLCTGIFLSAFQIPVLQKILHLTKLPLHGWALVALFSLLPTVIIQIYLLIKKYGKKK